MITKDNITKEQLQDLIVNNTLRNIARKILHIRDINLDKLLNKFGIQKIPFYKRRKYPNISQDAKEFIFGSLLGDASVVKKGPQYRLSLSHGLKQKEYIEHKKEMLGELSLNNVQEVHTKGHYLKENFIKDYSGFVLHSKVHPFFTEVRQNIYPNNKKTINDWWLNQVTAKSLAYWIMDDGSADYCDNSYVVRISTEGFTKEENLVLKNFLYNKFTINANLQKVNRGCGFYLRLNTESSKKLRDLIMPYITKCMMYKVSKDAWFEYKKYG